MLARVSQGIFTRPILLSSIRRSLSSQAPTPAKKPETELEGHRPLYATKAKFEQHQKEQRSQSAGAEHGHKPTPLQRKFLVLTSIYKNASEIPEYVQHGTMNRMHDRMRVVFIIVGCLTFFTIFFVIESVNAARIARDRAAGKVVTKL